MNLFENVRNETFESCQPFFSTIELGLACQFKCHHCYNFDRQDPNSSFLENSIREMLSKEEVLDIIKQLADAGAMQINFTGGEPLLNHHIVEYIQYAKSLACFPRLKSNGGLLTKTKSIELYEAGLDEVDLSLYGYDENSYEAFTGRRDFQKVVQGIQNAKEAGIKVFVSLILHKGNYKKISEMTNLIQSLGVEFNYSDEITDRYDKTKNKNVELGPLEMEELLQGEHRELFEYHSKDTDNFQCSCARNVCGISYKGDVYPCIGAPIVAGNIRNQKFSQIWEKSPIFEKIRSLGKADFKSCMDCSVAEFCDRSSGTVYVNTGDYTGCDTRYLENAKLRKKLHKIDNI